MKGFLTAERVKELEDRHRLEKDAIAADRIKALLLYNQGRTYKQIADILLQNEETIEREIEAYKSTLYEENLDKQCEEILEKLAQKFEGSNIVLANSIQHHKEYFAEKRKPTKYVYEFLHEYSDTVHDREYRRLITSHLKLTPAEQAELSIIIAHLPHTELIEWPKCYSMLNQKRYDANLIALAWTGKDEYGIPLEVLRKLNRDTKNEEIPSLLKLAHDVVMNDACLRSRSYRWDVNDHSYRRLNYSAIVCRYYYDGSPKRFNTRRYVNQNAFLQLTDEKKVELSLILASMPAMCFDHWPMLLEKFDPTRYDRKLVHMAVNSITLNGITALGLVCDGSRSDLAKKLINLGADMYAGSTTAVQWAELRFHFEYHTKGDKNVDTSMIKVLLENGMHPKWFQQYESYDPPIKALIIAQKKQGTMHGILKLLFAATNLQFDNLAIKIILSKTTEFEVCVPTLKDTLLLNAICKKTFEHFYFADTGCQYNW